MYGGYYGYGYYWDPTYFLVLVGLVLCLGASALVNSTMRKYSKVRNMRGLTGAEAARRRGFHVHIGEIGGDGARGHMRGRQGGQGPAPGPEGQAS